MPASCVECIKKSRTIKRLRANILELVEEHDEETLKLKHIIKDKVNGGTEKNSKLKKQVRNLQRTLGERNVAIKRLKENSTVEENEKLKEQNEQLEETNRRLRAENAELQRRLAHMIQELRQEAAQ